MGEAFNMPPPSPPLHGPPVIVLNEPFVPPWVKKGGNEKKSSLSEALNQFRVESSLTPSKTKPVFIDMKNEDKKSTVRIVCVSDTHLHQDRLVVPSGDILIHSGDFTNYGKEDEVKSVNEWLGKQPHKYKIVICGNHEEGLAVLSREEVACILSNATHYLHDSGAVVCGVHFWGSPWVPNMGGDPNEKFMKQFDNKFFYKAETELIKHWEMIPSTTQYLITHTPPFGTLDSKHGSISLAFRLKSLPQLKVHQFGHVHSAVGFQSSNGLLSINAAMDDTEQPFFFDFALE